MPDAMGFQYCEPPLSEWYLRQSFPCRPKQHILFIEMIGHFAGEQLAESPDHRVQGNDLPNLSQIEMVDGQQDGKQAPYHAVIEVVH